MRKLFYSLLFLSLSSFAEDINYIAVSTPLRNKTLVNLVRDEINSVLYHEDEGIETRIFKVTTEPTISQVGKMGRKTVHLEVLTDVKIANFYTNTNRRAPPFGESDAYCLSTLKKNTNNVWESTQADCDIVLNQD